MKTPRLRGFLTAAVVLVCAAAVAAGCAGQPDNVGGTGAVQSQDRDGSASVSNDSPVSGRATLTSGASDASDGTPASDREGPGAAGIESGSATEPGLPSQTGPMGRLQKAVEFEGPVADDRAELGSPVLTIDLYDDSIAFTVDRVAPGADRTVVELDGIGLWLAETPHDGDYIDTFIVPVPAGQTVRWRAAFVVDPGLDGAGYAIGPWTEWSVLESPAHPPYAGVTRAEVITVYPESRWADLMVSLSEAERRCIQDSLGDDFERVMTLPVVSDGDAQQHEVDVFGCLSRDKAGRLFVAILKADYPEPVGASAEYCLTELLARTDLAELYRRQMDMDGNSDDTVVIGFSDDVVKCLGDGSLNDDVPAPSP